MVRMKAVVIVIVLELALLIIGSNIILRSMMLGKIPPFMGGVMVAGAFLLFAALLLLLGEAITKKTILEG